MRLSNLEKRHDYASRIQSQETNQLKEVRRRGSNTAELKVTGIPVDNIVAFSDLANKLLNVLKLQDLCRDILEVRELKARKYKTTVPALNVIALSENATNVNTTNGNASNDNSRKKFTGFIIQFKSDYITRHILKIKRQHGPVKFSDLVSDGSDTVISVFEMLPPFLNDLRILARDKATERGYKHVWPVNGSIYVKKDDTSIPIVISTEHDLNNIV